MLRQERTDLLNVPILITEVAACVRPNVSDRAISLASLESSFLQRFVDSFLSRLLALNSASIFCFHFAVWIRSLSQSAKSCAEVDRFTALSTAALTRLRRSRPGPPTHHGSSQFALFAPGAAIQTHALCPISHVSPIAFPLTGSMLVDNSRPFKHAVTSSPYGIITGRTSPVFHSGNRTS